MIEILDTNVSFTSRSFPRYSLASETFHMHYSRVVNRSAFAAVLKQVPLVNSAFDLAKIWAEVYEGVNDNITERSESQ